MATAERGYVALIGCAIARDLAIWEKIPPALKLFDTKTFPEFLSSSQVTELHMTRLPPFILEKWQVYLYTSPNEAADHTISNCFPMVWVYLIYQLQADPKRSTALQPYKLQLCSFPNLQIS